MKFIFKLPLLLIATIAIALSSIMLGAASNLVSVRGKVTSIPHLAKQQQQQQNQPIAAADINAIRVILEGESSTVETLTRQDGLLFYIFCCFDIQI